MIALGPPVLYRMRVFISREVFENYRGVWTRCDLESDESLNEQLERWQDQTKVQLVFPQSQPSLLVYREEGTGEKLRLIRFTAVTVVYVLAVELQEETREFDHDFEEEKANEKKRDC